MAKIRGVLSAFYIQSTAASTLATGQALSRVGTSLWYMVASSTNYWWDKAKTIIVYDGATPVVPLEFDYQSGAVRLAAVPGGAVTATFYKFAGVQFGGFRSFSIDENMELIESGCFEDGLGETWDAGMYSATGSGDGFWSSVDSSHNFNGLTLLAKPLGALGDAISAECIVAGSNTPLTVTVAAQKITINSATGSGGAATSKNCEIKDAIEANTDAAALVNCKYTTDYATNNQTVMGAITVANLAGGVVPEMLSRFGEDILAVFYWDAGAALRRSVGLITFEKQSIKTGVKGLVGKSLSFKFQGIIYDHNS
jgi:hypothetical protein